MEAPERTRVPSLHRRHTRRPRLTRLLDTRNAQTILIIAPPGYGKTSLACEWLEGRDSVAWYRATSASADVAAFSVALAEVVAPLVPGAGGRLRQRLRVAEPPEKAARPLAELLAEDLAQWPEEAWLVVDDYHLVIDSAPVEEFMDWLLMLSPIRLLVTTRRRPRWASARRTLYGEVAEITKDQLAMTSDEATQVLAGRSTEAVRTLVAQAQGWPALIGLAALSETAEIPDERVLDSLFRYFAEEVFRQEPPDVQHFMLVASIPPIINLEIARDVLEVDGAAETLARLREEGLLQESGTGEFAFHPLLREFLRRRILSEQADFANSLGVRVAAFAQSAGRWDEAFDLAIQRNGISEAVCIVAKAAPALLAEGRIETVEKWLFTCGHAILRQPDSALVKAEVLLRRARHSEALNLAEHVVSRMDSQHPKLSHGCCVVGRAARCLSHDTKALDFFLQARSTARCEEDLANALWGAFLSAADLELDDVGQHLTAFRSLSADDIDVRLRAAAGTAIAARTRGSLADVVEALQPVLPLVEYSSDPLVTSVYLAYLGYVHSMASRYSVARTMLLRARDVCTQFRLTFNAALCEVIRVHAEIGEREWNEARRILAALETSAPDFEDPFVDASISVLSARLALAVGDFSILEHFPKQPSARTPPRAIDGEYHALLGIAAAAKGALDRAAQEIALAQGLTSTVETVYLARFGQVISAIGSTTNASASARQAAQCVIDAHEAGAVDAFVVAYRAFPQLLQALRSEPEITELIGQTFLLAHDTPLAASYGFSESRASAMSSLVGTLTKRETEVLHLIGQGLSNAAIAERLVIAESTAKVHVHRVFKKLGAQTRLQAALLARGLSDDRDD